MKTLFSQELVLAVLLAGMFGLSACSTTTNTVEPAQPTAQRQMLADKRVITDTSLDKSCRILSVNANTGPGGFLKIQVEVQNLTESRKSFTYRVEWFDENGMIINLPTMTAIPRSLEGKETASITATAPTDRAKDFRIKFIEPTR
jgi:uncharacterized protein YcfL